MLLIKSSSIVLSELTVLFAQPVCDIFETDLKSPISSGVLVI